VKFNHSTEFVIANTPFYYTGLHVFTVLFSSDGFGDFHTV